MPRRLAWSLLKETTGLYVLGVAALCLLLSVDLLSVLARFLIEQDAGLGTVARLLVFKLPWFLHLAMPVAAVFAVMLAAGRMGRDSELKAAQAGGIPPSALLLPVVAWGVLVSGLTLLNNGEVEPRAERAYEAVIDGFLYSRPPAASQRNVSYLLDGTVFHAARMQARRDDPAVADLYGVLVRRPDGTLLTAREGTWDGREATWTLQDGQRIPTGAPPDPLGGVELAFPLPSEPSETLQSSATQTLGDLAERVTRVLAAGGDAREARFELHRRLADASSAAVFTLAAAALALRLRGRAAGFAWTIVLVVLFWSLWTLSAALFEQRVLGPVPAAWLTPAAVAMLGALLAWRSHRG